MGLGIAVVSRDSPSRESWMETQVDIQAKKLYLELFIWFGGRGERYLRMETGVLHRVSIQIL